MNIIILMIGFLKKNWFGIFGILIGVIGTVYSVVESKKEREPAYFVTKNVGLFSSPKGLSSEYFAFIKRSDNSEVLNNVYLLEASFWNKGKESIKAEDVLDPISIELSDDIEIIDAFVARSTRKNITKPELKYDKENKKLVLSFRVLEKEDSIGIQVLYSAKRPAEFNIDGAILGVRSILTKDDLAADNLVNGGIKTFKGFLWMVGGVMLFVFFAVATEFLLGKAAEKNKKIVARFAAIMVGAIILLAIIFFGYIVANGILRNAEKSIIEGIPVGEKIYPLKE